MQMMARTILVYDISEDAFISSLVAMGWAPSLLFVSIFGGVIGDRFERRNLIQVSQAANASMALAIAFLILSNNIHWVHLLVVSFLQGAMFALQLPARQAMIPSIVGKHRIANAIALNSMAMSLMTVLAPGVGGLIYGVFGPDYVYFIIAGITFGAVIFTGLIPRVPPSILIRERTILQNIGDGWKYISRQPVIRTILLQGVLLALLTMPFRMLTPVFAEDVYGSNPQQVGYLVATAGIGGFLGSFGIATLRKGDHRGFILLATGIIAAASIVVLAAMPFYLIGIVMMIGIGIGESGRWALGQAIMMEQADEQYRARVMSFMMMTYGLLPVGLIPFGAAIQRWGALTPTLFMGIAALIAAVSFLLFSTSIRRLK